MGFLEILMRPTIGTVKGQVLLGFLVGYVLGWTLNKWAALGFCLFQRSAPASPSAAPVSSVSSSTPKEHLAITEEDLDHMLKLVQKKDGGRPWKHIMDHKTPNMSCQAWQRDPVTGPPQYCTRTVYEDARPEMVRDFFWDDEFRLEWDDMLLHATTIDECPTTGIMAVHWIRKFPFFCSDREYIIGRRIWESVGTYYCVTKGVPYPLIPRTQQPKRVDIFYSSWYIRAVPSIKSNGEMTACEVTLFHHEDMGIPWEVAKIAVWRGMRKAVQNVEAGFRAYQNQRASGSPLSRTALKAQINTKVDLNRLTPTEPSEESPQANSDSSSKKKADKRLRKLVIIGGIVFLVSKLDRDFLSKILMINGAVKRFSKRKEGGHN